MRWRKLYNPFVGALLRSPLHGFMSNSTMLLTYTGRKSGKTYTTPVSSALRYSWIATTRWGDKSTPTGRRGALTRSR